MELIRREIIQTEPFLRIRTTIKTIEIIPNNIESSLDPLWIVGFIEGEGCFSVHYSYNKKLNIRYEYPRFDICQDNKEILEKIRDFFGFGIITKKYVGNPAYHYIVNSIKNCQKIANFLNGNLQNPKKKKQFDKWIRRDFWKDNRRKF